MSTFVYDYDYDYDYDSINDFIIKFKLINLAKEYKDNIKVNKKFNINSLDLSCAGELALPEINKLFPEIYIDEFELVTEEIAELLDITLSYTDEDLASNSVENIAYVGKVNSTYINRFLKNFNGNISELKNFYKIYDNYYTLTELFVSKTREYYILFNVDIELEFFIDLIRFILDIHLYCKRNVIKNGKGLQL